MKYDIIVIGAGPAGSSAAITLSQSGCRVLLLEKSRFPREKLCGEFLTPECLPLFDRLGVRERLIEAGAASIRHWTIHPPEGTGIDIPLSWIADGYPYALGLSRARMDQILLDRAREVGVEVREEFQVSPEFFLEGGDSLVQGHRAGQAIESFRAGLVIDASGRNGVFSRRIEQPVSRFHGARVFGCKVHLKRIEGLRDRGELYFFADGYGGLSDIEGDRTNLCFLTTEKTLLAARGDREKLLDLTLRTNRAARERLTGAEVAGEWLGTGPITYGRHRTLPGVLAIGDAGAFIDPFTGSGMLLALSSGILAGEVIDQYFAAGAGDRESIISAYRHRHRGLFSRRYRAVSMLRSLAFRPAMRSLLVGLLSRHQSLARAVARSTRMNRQGAPGGN